MKKVIFVFLGIIGCFQICHARDWTYSGYLAHNTISQNKALEEGIGDKAIGFGFSVNLLTDHFITMSAGTELILYDDKQRFSQNIQVTRGFNSGDIRPEISDADGVLVFFDIGPHFKLGNAQKTYFAIKGGVSTLLYSDRAISNCRDCYEENIDIDGGFYIQSSIVHNFENVSVGLHDIRYMDEDNGLDHSLRFAIGFGF